MTFFNRFHQLARTQRVAWTFLLVSFMLTGAAWYLTDRYVQFSAQQRFSFLTAQISEEIKQRLREAQTILRASAGFVDGSEQTTRYEWHRFISALELEKTHRSIQFIGYLPFLRGHEISQHESTVHQFGHSTYRVWPEGQREKYTPIAFLEPETDANLLALGFDAYSEPVRRTVIDHAIDSGESVVSPRLGLRIHATHPETGFLIYMPIYKTGSPHDSIEARKQNIRGLTLAAIKAESFVADLGINDLGTIDFELFDTETPHPEGLLYDNHPENGLIALEQTPTPDLVARVEIPNRPHTWSLFLHAKPSFLTYSERYLPYLVGLGGVIIDLLLFLLIWIQGRHRVQLEHLSGNLKDRLTTSEQVLSSAIEMIGEAFVIYDAEDKLIFCNEQYRQVYKRSASVIEPGKTFEEIIRYGAEHGQYKEAIGHVDEWVKERMAKHRAANSEIVQQLDDGRWIKIRERRTQIGHIVGIRMDLTEIYNAKEAAESANRAKSRFLATISHEIRTPMNGILGMAQVLLDPDIPADKRNEHVRTILRSGQALLRILNEILDLSKIEAGHFELVSVEFSPTTLIEETVQLFMASAVGKGLRLSWHSEQANPERYIGDPDRIRQMLSNLIGNAIKFTAAGEVNLSFKVVSAAGDEALLEFSVEDTGQGISDELQANLFKPFSQLDTSASRKHPGTGLGLSIVRQLARLMNGEAGLSSQPGQGSRFWFQIRVQRQRAPNQRLTAPQTLASMPNPQIPAMQLKGRILVAEDNATHRLVITTMLTRQGLDVTVAEDGTEAVNAVASGGHFDLIMLDLIMPHLDGIAAMHEIRKIYEQKQLIAPPVIAITAQAYEQDREMCLQAGMADILTKPIDFKQVSKTLDRYLPKQAESDDLPSTLDIDRTSILADIAALRPMLLAHKFDAFTAFKHLQKNLAGTRWQTTLSEIDTLLQRMAFDQAVLILDRLSESLGETE